MRATESGAGEAASRFWIFQRVFLLGCGLASLGLPALDSPASEGVASVLPAFAIAGAASLGASGRLIEVAESRGWRLALLVFLLLCFPADLFSRGVAGGTGLRWTGFLLMLWPALALAAPPNRPAAAQELTYLARRIWIPLAVIIAARSWPLASCYLDAARVEFHALLADSKLPVHSDLKGVDPLRLGILRSSAAIPVLACAAAAMVWRHRSELAAPRFRVSLVLAAGTISSLGIATSMGARLFGTGSDEIAPTVAVFPLLPADDSWSAWERVVIGALRYFSPSSFTALPLLQGFLLIAATAVALLLGNSARARRVLLTVGALALLGSVAQADWVEAYFLASRPPHLLMTIAEVSTVALCAAWVLVMRVAWSPRGYGASRGVDSPDAPPRMSLPLWVCVGVPILLLHAATIVSVVLHLAVATPLHVLLRFRNAAQQADDLALPLRPGFDPHALEAMDRNRERHRALLAQALSTQNTHDALDLLSATLCMRFEPQARAGYLAWQRAARPEGDLVGLFTSLEQFAASQLPEEQRIATVEQILVILDAHRDTPAVRGEIQPAFEGFRDWPWPARLRFATGPLARSYGVYCRHHAALHKELWLFRLRCLLLRYVLRHRGFPNSLEALLASDSAPGAWRRPAPILPGFTVLDGITLQTSSDPPALTMSWIVPRKNPWAAEWERTLLKAPQGYWSRPADGLNSQSHFALQLSPDGAPELYRHLQLTRRRTGRDGVPVPAYVQTTREFSIPNPHKGTSPAAPPSQEPADPSKIRRGS